MIRPVFLAACALWPFAIPALSQTETRVVNGQSFGAWTISCEAVAVGETACVLNQTLLRDTDRAFVAQMLAVWSSDGQQRYILARVPAGVYLPSGMAMRPETEGGEDQVLELVWQSCTANICEALVEIDEETLTAFSAEGVTVVASYQPTRNSPPLVFRFAMAGVLDGMAAVAPTP